jgi:hypothetical protein
MLQRILTSFRFSTPVSLKAREVLILGQLPPYEERLHQMKTALKNSVTDNYYGYQVHPIGTTDVYDIPDLFSKALHNIWIKARNTDRSLVRPKSFLEPKELVLDEHD